MRPAVAIGLVACGAPNTPPSQVPRSASREATAPVDVPGAAGSDTAWVAVDCAKLLTRDDVATLCGPRRELAELAPDSGEGAITAAAAGDPPLRATCSRTVRLDGGGVAFHAQVIDYSTAAAREKITDVWTAAAPSEFRDGLYIHEVHAPAIRHDVEGYRGRLAISVFEADQPGHAPLCQPEQLVELVRRMVRRLP